MLTLGKKKNLNNRGNYTEGPILAPLLSIGFSLLLSGLLEKTYHLADNIIIGKFSGDPYAIGAIGSTGPAVTLLTSVIFGLAVGSNVIIARKYGAKDYKAVSDTIHSSVLFSAIAGFIIAILGSTLCVPLLELLGTKAEFMEGARNYLSIYFWGVPFSAVFNYASGGLRGTGNQSAPTTILFISGIINVFLNLIFVVTLGLGTGGVALATVISQIFSAVAVLWVLMRGDERFPFRFSLLRIDGAILRGMLVIGIPVCIQNSLSSITSFVTSQARNTLSAEAVTSYSITMTILSFTGVAITAFTVTPIIAFVGQNWGANNFARVKRCLILSSLSTVVLFALIATPQILFSDFLAGMFMESGSVGEEQIKLLVGQMLTIMLFGYFISGFDYIFISFLRATGRSVIPMLISVFSTTVLCCFWCWFVFPLPAMNNPIGYVIMNPLSAFISTLLKLANAIIVFKKEKLKSTPI